MRVMGLDFGSKTVGVAVSDALGITAQGVETVRRTDVDDLRATLDRLLSLTKEYDIGKIVTGLPKNMDGSVGAWAEKVISFAKKVEKKTGLPVIMWDERLTSVAAKKVLIEGGVRREKRKQHIDKIAAVFILQGYLDSQRLSF